MNKFKLKDMGLEQMSHCETVSFGGGVSEFTAWIQDKAGFAVGYAGGAIVAYFKWASSLAAGCGHPHM